MFSLPDIALLIEHTPTQTKTLSGGTICLILTALAQAELKHNWIGEGLTLTAAELDDIDRLVSNAYDEILRGW